MSPNPKAYEAPVKAPEPTPVVEPPAEEAQPVVYQPKALSQRNPVSIAEHFYRSGFFPDVKSLSQAVVKIMAGEEIGIGHMTAIKGITIIEGTLGYTGNLVATLIKRHPTYEYKVLERTNERCLIEFYDGEDLLGESEFTVDDAEKAELVKPKSNWVKWPRAMCFNRALTEGARAYIPDITAGSPAYTDDEIEEVVTAGPVAAETVQEDGLPPERLDELLKGYEIAGPHLGGVNELDGLNFLLGTLGLDGIEPGEGVDDRVTQAFRGLTEEQAYELEAEFKQAVDKAEAANADA